MTDDQGLAEQALGYYERKQSSGQWSVFIGLFFDELLESAGEEDGRAFLYHLGNRIGEGMDLGTQDTLEGLQKAMNSYLEQLDWGIVTLRERESGLFIRHSAYPLPGLQLDPKKGTLAMTAILEGLYAAWFTKQSGDDSIPLQLTNSGQRRVLEFVYGRH